MKIDELKLYLRMDFNNHIRPLYIKDKCEHCGEEHELHLHHHSKHFAILLEETLAELKLLETEEFTNEQARIIKYVMRGKQITVQYLTLCKKCHIEVHKVRRKREFKPNNPYEFILNDEYLNRYLDKEERAYLLNNYGTKIKHKTGFYCSWNNFLQQLIDNGYYYKKEGADYIIYDYDIDNVAQEQLKEYLQQLINKRLYKEEQQELIEMIGLKDNKGRIQRRISTLNGYLIDNFNMTLISKKVKKQGRIITIWIITPIN